MELAIFTVLVWFVFAGLGLRVMADNNIAMYRGAGQTAIVSLMVGVITVYFLDSASEFSAAQIFGDTFWVSLMSVPAVVWMLVIVYATADAIHSRIQRRRKMRSRLDQYAGS